MKLTEQADWKWYSDKSKQGKGSQCYAEPIGGRESTENDELMIICKLLWEMYVSSQYFFSLHVHAPD